MCKIPKALKCTSKKLRETQVLVETQAHSLDLQFRLSN